MMRSEEVTERLKAIARTVPNLSWSPVLGAVTDGTHTLSVSTIIERWDEIAPAGDDGSVTSMVFGAFTTHEMWVPIPDLIEEMAMAASAHRASESALVDAVEAAREAGATWQQVAQGLGMKSRQQAQDWFRRKSRPSP